MRQYETAFLISPNLPEEETEKIITQMADIISRKKGKIIKEDRWGKRKLAYPIKKFEEAFYVFFHYEGGTDISSELERHFKQTEAVLRFLTIKKEIKMKTEKKKKAAPKPEESPTSVETEEVKKEETSQEALPPGETSEKES